MNYSQEAVQANNHGQRGTPPEVLELVQVALLGGFRVSIGPRVIEDGGWRLRKVADLGGSYRRWTTLVRSPFIFGDWVFSPYLTQLRR